LDVISCSPWKSVREGLLLQGKAPPAFIRCENVAQVDLAVKLDNVREAGGWRLEAGGWRLEAGGWRLEAGGLRIIPFWLSGFFILT
jgi:hypothetical protein